MERDRHHGNDYPLGTLATVAASWRRGMTIGLGFAWVRFSLFVPMDSHKLLMKI